jgi:glucan phosphoethanolaminetransferase (alkaline phosphatase superfamily)
MDFSTALMLLHLVSCALTVSGTLIFLKIAGLKCFDLNEAPLRWKDWSWHQIDLASAAMMAGVLGLCFTIGAIFAQNVLSTSQLPPNNVMVIRVGILAIIICAAIALHLYARPLIRDEREIARAELSQIAVLSVAASLAMIAEFSWLILGTQPSAMMDLAVLQSFAALLKAAVVVWMICGAFLIAAIIRAHNRPAVPVPEAKPVAFPQAPPRLRPQYRSEPQFAA